ncbi:hypothetical protein K431DRAFT_299686 [Polychaeton citri CBS 116435]|uniref:Uncharacterized protein n=1 Tax=Polychaeton citri CBS 116435 TaxID=1314669 RepID=A0A9P4QEU5_9PEZI|nr:hypothetical protein K431DRAFT_299686 [Polychaeton citri CBS 116435]
MQFKAVMLATLVSLAAAVPSSIGLTRKLARAIDYGTFTEAELADTNPESCCCCVPPSEISNVDVLHKLIDASDQKTKRAVDYSQFTEEELANDVPSRILTSTQAILQIPLPSMTGEEHDSGNAGEKLQLNNDNLLNMSEHNIAQN